MMTASNKKMSTAVFFTSLISPVLYYILTGLDDRFSRVETINVRLPRSTTYAPGGELSFLPPLYVYLNGLIPHTDSTFTTATTVQHIISICSSGPDATRAIPIRNSSSRTCTSFPKKLFNHHLHIPSLSSSLVTTFIYIIWNPSWSWLLAAARVFSGLCMCVTVAIYRLFTCVQITTHYTNVYSQGFRFRNPHWMTDEIGICKKLTGKSIRFRLAQVPARILHCLSNTDVNQDTRVRYLITEFGLKFVLPSFWRVFNKTNIVLNSSLFLSCMSRANTMSHISL